MRRLKYPLLALFAALSAVVVWGFFEGRAEPVVRRAAIALPGWPEGQAPVQLVLLSDLHAGNIATTDARLERIVKQVNALKPDLVLIAGDFLPGHAAIGAEAAIAALAPLKRLRARLGVLAVPGNHDHWTGLAAVRSALAAAGVELLANAAVTRGPLVVGGVDDAFTKHARTAQTVAAMRRLPGARIAFTHSPDVAPELPPDVTLLLAGHTHCGQAMLPLIGSLDPVLRYDIRYRCGIVRKGARTTIVTAGIGGSMPLRLNAPPDLWLVKLGPR